MDLPKCTSSHARTWGQTLTYPNKEQNQTGRQHGYPGSARRAKLGFAKQPEGRANSSSVVVVVVVEEKEFEVAGGPKLSRCRCRGLLCCCSCCCVDGEPSAVAVMMNGDVDGDDDDVPMPRPARSEAESRCENSSFFRLRLAHPRRWSPRYLPPLVDFRKSTP